MVTMANEVEGFAAEMADEAAFEAVIWLDGGADTCTDDVLVCDELS